MMYQVMERALPHTSYWHTSPGLDGIPAELRERTVATIRELNERLGWVKYLVIGNLGYEECLRNEEEHRTKLGVRRNSR